MNAIRLGVMSRYLALKPQWRPLRNSTTSSEMNGQSLVFSFESVILVEQRVVRAYLPIQPIIAVLEPGGSPWLATKRLPRAIC